MTAGETASPQTDHLGSHSLLLELPLRFFVELEWKVCCLFGTDRVAARSFREGRSG